jgi:agmatinase
LGLGIEALTEGIYMGAHRDYENSDIVIAGCPLDITSSFRSGSKFAPDSIRKASWTLETYSPYFGRDLKDFRISDLGNIPLLPVNLERSFNLIEKRVLQLLRDSKKPLFLGGEHLITYPIVKAINKRFSTTQIIHFDAHWDMRDSYEGMEFCHATVMKKVEELGNLRVFHVGVRSGTEDEFRGRSVIKSPERLREEIEFEKPVYITFDMDVLDPSLVPGVTTPEPGGLMFDQVMDYIVALSGFEVIGADVVELAPDYDPTFVSSICAAKIVREILMLMG